jgi:hypothetical protein
MNKTTPHYWATSTFIFAMALILPHLPIKIASAATYYVATTGNNANSCAAATSTASPKRTIAAGIACMSAGDTLRIRQGTYTEFITSVASGTSYANAPVIESYPGELATIRPGSGPNKANIIGLGSTSQHHVIFRNLKVDGAGIFQSYTIWLNGAHHIRFDGVEILNGGSDGVLISGGAQRSDFIEFLNCNVHDNGFDDVGHGIYIEQADNLVDGCEIHDNHSYGIHVYSGHPGQPNNNIIRNNRVYDNVLGGTGGGMTIGGVGNLIYNNLVYNNNGTGIFNKWGNPRNSKLINNTVWGNRDAGIDNGDSGTLISNNISFGNGGSQILAGSATLQTNLTTNPGFINAAVGNFRLQVGSVAINLGTARAEVKVDMAGVNRPQGSAYDIGAYEFSIVDGTPPAPPKGLKVN